MESLLLQWLTQVAAAAFIYSMALLLALDAVALGAVYVTRDRRLVDRWTKPVLVVNFMLLGSGIGVPLAAFGAGITVKAIAPIVRVMSQPPVFTGEREGRS